MPAAPSAMSSGARRWALSVPCSLSTITQVLFSVDATPLSARPTAVSSWPTTLGSRNHGFLTLDLRASSITPPTGVEALLKALTPSRARNTFLHFPLVSMAKPTTPAAFSTAPRALNVALAGLSVWYSPTPVNAMPTALVPAPPDRRAVPAFALVCGSASSAAVSAGVAPLGALEPATEPESAVSCAPAEIPWPMALGQLPLKPSSIAPTAFFKTLDSCCPTGCISGILRSTIHPIVLTSVPISATRYESALRYFAKPGEERAAALPASSASCIAGNAVVLSVISGSAVPSCSACAGEPARDASGCCGVSTPEDRSDDSSDADESGGGSAGAACGACACRCSGVPNSCSMRARSAGSLGSLPTTIGARAPATWLSSEPRRRGSPSVNVRAPGVGGRRAAPVGSLPLRGRCGSRSKVMWLLAKVGVREQYRPARRAGSSVGNVSIAILLHASLPQHAAVRERTSRE